MSPKREPRTTAIHLLHESEKVLTRRLGVTDHALHRREGTAQAALELIDPLVHLDDGDGRIRAAMEVHELAGFAVAHTHVVDVVQHAVLGCKPSQFAADDLDAAGSAFGAER